MKNNMMKKLLTLVLAGAMTLSLAACGAKDTQPDSGTDGSTPRSFRVAIIKQLDHASLDEIANAVAADETQADTGWWERFLLWLDRIRGREIEEMQ